MLIKVTAVAAPNLFTKDLPQRAKVKFYEPHTPKQRLQEDFGTVLEKEINKLHFEKVV